VTPEDRSRETQILHLRMADYWHEVDLNSGVGASAYYTEDGVFEGGNEPLVGREAINAFYQWRIGRGVRTSRHVVTNFRADFQDATHATTYCIMLLFAADGAPILPSTPPIMITDLIDECVKGDDGQWLYKRRSFTPLFQGQIAPTVPPADLAKSHNLKKT
jgi:hypothetical protein